MRIGDYVIAAGGELIGDWGGFDGAIRTARRMANGGEWAVFIPACRSWTAGRMLVRSKGRRVRWTPTGREALRGDVL